MSDFSKKIQVEEGVLKFDFMRVYTVQGVRYYVAVVDKSGKAHLFQMQEKESQWKIVLAPKAPDWILEIEAQLGEAISENNEPTQSFS